MMCYGRWFVRSGMRIAPYFGSLAQFGGSNRLLTGRPLVQVQEDPFLRLRRLFFSEVDLGKRNAQTAEAFMPL